MWLPRVFKALPFLLLCFTLNAKPPAYVIHSTTDRYGGTAILWIAAMLISHETEVPLYHVCNTRCLIDPEFPNLIYHKILDDFCAKGPPPKDAEVLEANRYTLPPLSSEIAGTDLPNALVETGLADEWYQYFETHAQNRGWKLRWNPQTTLVIHVRLEDRAPKKKRDGNPVGFKPDVTKRGQGYIGDAKLQRLIRALHTEYPDHDIHIVTAPWAKDINRCKRVTSPFPYVKGVWGDKDMDYAIWQMMNTDVLVFARSYFGFLAGYLHRGSECISSEQWKHFYHVAGYRQDRKWKMHHTADR